MVLSHSRRNLGFTMSIAERLTGLNARDNVPIALVGLGHGATHWVAATFYLLLPSLSTTLGLDYAATGLLVSILHVSAFLANLGSGPLTDVTGRRVALQVISLLLGAAALATLGLVGGLLAVVGLVAVIGVSNNLWHPPAISYLSARFPGQRGWALSVHALGAGLGDAIAPLAAGALLAALTWQGVALYASLPVLAVAAVIAIGLGRAPGSSHGEGGKGVDFAQYLSGLAAVVKDKAVLGLCLMSAFRSMTQNGLMVFLPLYLAHEMAVSPLVMGIALAALQGGGLIATPIAGRLSDRVGRRQIVLAGLGVSTVAIVVLTLLGGEVSFIAGVSVLGFALFAIRPVVHSWMMDLTPSRLGGSATSLMFGAQTGLSILAPVVGGMIADTYGLVATFYALAGTMLITNLLAWRLPNTKPAP
ncbi:MAG: MFS transporter [Alphaproteobacteria bacterium]|nr:MFS transporter [Alphaproteobacteria bacterium]